MRAPDLFAQRMANMRRPHFGARPTDPICKSADFGQLKMSSITQFHVSAHADYRRSDYVFAREQSRALSQREWEHPTPGLRAWGHVVIPALTAAAAMSVALAALS